MFLHRRLLRRIALVALLAVSLGLLTAYYRDEGGPLHTFQQASIAQTTPVRDAVSRVTAPFRDLAGWVGDIDTAREERDGLREENARLRAALATLQVNQQDWSELEPLVGFVRAQRPEALGGYKPQAARVIARSGRAFQARVLLDVGSKAGVAEGDPVLAAVSDARVPEGAVLVGRVTDVSGTTALVTLLDDPTTSVGAIVAGRRGSDGVIQPNAGDPSTLVLDFVRKSAAVQAGDIVVTSGFAEGGVRSFYPRGLAVGAVTAARNTDTESYKQIVVTPWVDLDAFTYALVLTGGAAAPGLTGGGAG